MQTTVEIKDGPLAGLIHELNNSFGLGVPDRIGLRDETDPELVHWHRVDGQHGYYESSERRPMPKT